MNKNRLDRMVLKESMPDMFIRFYLVGLLLFMIPFTRGFFVAITSLSLLLVIGAIFVFHTNWNVKTIVWFTFIFISAFFVEMAGTHTGEIFGEYHYGKGLAPLINGTPLIIGLNWLFLTYASHDISRLLSSRPWLRILLGALLMVAYDLILEWVAPSMQMWQFASGYPPFKNFLVWFFIAIAYHSGFEILDIRSDNRPARTLFVIQMCFFVIIGLYSLIFIS